ncbi:MAG: DUF262 domain-containing HNH endonuclease family protein [Dehalococcoidia bacterium]|nr:DUF262 domain-containing HNH endonuclease family protein [Dehalococcoidia bacterium]
MPETIQATELQLRDIFNDKYRFNIPDYQRPYSWTTEQTSELLDDLLYAMDEYDDVEEASPYFLGSIVIVKNDTSPKANVVDGQQRITTLTILFCVLRELTTDIARKGTRDHYVREISDPDAGIEGDFRVSVRERDSEFFRVNIQEINKLGELIGKPHAVLPESQQRMAENAEYLWRELSKRPDKERDFLMSFLLRRCYLVVVSTSDQDSAYRIFSVLNDRGLDLSPTDILKAQIIGSLDSSIRNTYTKTWEDIEEDLGREDFRSLFAHIRMVFMKEKARGSLNKEFQENVLKGVTGRDFVDDVLSPYADAYENLFPQSSGGLGDLELYLTYLARLDNVDWIPPAMEFFKRNPDKPEDTLCFVRALERLAYGMFILRLNINERISRYAEVLRSIQKGEALSDEGALQLTDDEKAGILSALDGPIYSLLRVRMPLMQRIDSQLAQMAGAGVTFHHKIISIEHVLPQNPRNQSKWLEWFPDIETREYWTHRIANLVLLSRRKNAQANNREFADKKHTYFLKGGVSPFTITTQVVSEPEWTPEVLERRQPNLIGILEEEWHLGE